VLAVDPAPGKPSTVFDGKAFRQFNGQRLRTFLDKPQNRTRETLVCWDAPLTGPPDPDSAGTRRGDFTKRLIERFFSRVETGFKVPKGISVRSYCECPHWTISRSLVGLPRTGPHDHHHRHLPFHLIPGPSSERAGRASIIEMHPAVAAWLWCRGDGYEGPWEYRNDTNILKNMWSIIRGRTQFPWKARPTPQNDDEFDAAVGYILGSLYVGGRAGTRSKAQEVTILGNRSTGSFLLPAVRGLECSWNVWINKQQPDDARYRHPTTGNTTRDARSPS